MNAREKDSPNKDMSDSTLNFYIDPFTKAYNRVFLFRFIPQKIGALPPNTKSALFMIDLDNFKNINDTYGHLSGDKVLEQVADALKKSLRDNDYLIRYAGDEFVAVLMDIDLSTSYKVVGRLMDNVQSSKIFMGGKTVNQTVSVGFSLYPDDAKDVESLVKYADQALYLAKRRGKNNFAYFKEVNISQISAKVAMDSFPCAEFIDRGDEINLIDSKLKEVKEKGLFHGVIVKGDSGVGKTRLLKQSTGIAKDKGFEIVSFSFSQRDASLPFTAIGRVFDVYLKEKFVQDRIKVKKILGLISQKDRDILSSVISLIKEVFPLSKESSGDKETIAKSFRSLINALVSENGLVFLSFDNSQYADLSFWSFLENLIQSAEESKGIFLLMGLSDPLSKDIPNLSDLKKAVSRMGKISSIDAVSLKYFTEEDTEKMIEALFKGLGKIKNLTEPVFKVTKGNPFFVEEMLKYFVDKSLIYFDDDMWKIKKLQDKMIPNSITEIVKKRLENLDPEIKDTLLISSVVGDSIDAKVLSKVRDVSESDILEILDKAKSLRLIREEDDGFGFHNVIKKIALTEIPDSRKKDIYGKVSDALMDVYKDNIETVSFRLAKMFNKVEDVDRLNKLSKMVNSSASNVMDSDKILEYMEELTEAAKEDELFAEAKAIGEEDIEEAVKLLGVFQQGLKNFKLYPKGSKIRESAVNDLYVCMVNIIKKYEAVNISEVERSLVVNQRRITPRLAKFVDVEDIVNLLIDRDIKSILFIKGLLPEELNAFLEVIVLEREERYLLGEWKELLADRKMEHISVNKALYLPPRRSSKSSLIKDKLENAELLDFILGKVSGRDIDNVNITSAIRKNPKLLSDELLKAADAAQVLDSNIDRVKMISQGMRKISDFAEEGKLTNVSDSDEKIDRNIGHSIADVFMGFDGRTKNQLIRRIDSLDDPIAKLIMSLDKNSFTLLIRDICSCGESIWGLVKSRMKLSEILEKSSFPYKDIFDAEISRSLSSEEEIKTVKGEIDYSALGIEIRVSDLLKMDKDMIAEVTDNDVVDILEEIIISGNHSAFKKMFVHLRDAAIEFPDILKTKVRDIYTAGFSKAYPLRGKHKHLADFFADLFSPAKKGRPKEALNYSLSLSEELITVLALDRFQRREEAENIEIYLNLLEIIQGEGNTLAPEEAAQWAANFGFKKVVKDVFNSYINGIIPIESINRYPDKLSRLLSYESDEIIEDFLKRITASYDPFEQFVLVRKIGPFVSLLEDKALMKFTQKSIDSLKSETFANILSYLDKDKFKSAMQSLYSISDDAHREIILNVISGMRKDLVEPLFDPFMEEETSNKLKDKVKSIFRR